MGAAKLAGKWRGESVDVGSQTAENDIDGAGIRKVQLARASSTASGRPFALSSAVSTRSKAFRSMV
jgi:hypothetical protein